MNTNTEFVDNRTPARTGVIHTFLCIFLFLIQAGNTSAAVPPTPNDIQIETTLNQLLEEQQAKIYKKIIEPDEPVSWWVYLPDNDSSEIPGVFVYISPMKTGRIDSRWREVMDEQNLIYIAANKSGNKTPTIRRMVMANLGIKALALEYAFDPGQINVSGFSGGGRVASRLASQYPEIYTGALYICGVDFWKKDYTPNVERVLQNRFVFLTGSRDFNENETRLIHKRYIKEGAVNSKLIVIPGMAHKHPDATYLTEALEFLLARN